MITETTITKLLRWLIFSVIVALLPFIFNSLTLLLNGTFPSIVLVCSNGDLLLVSAAISAAALGELIGNDTNKKKIAKIFAGGGCLAILILASYLYAYIANSLQSGTSLNKGMISKYSIWSLIFATLTSGSCIVLSEMKEVEK